MNKSRGVFKRTQRGATLVIALLILVMITMYGIPAAMDSIQNERMTGNTRQRDLAFQAAEHALKKAEAWLLTKTSSQLNVLAPAAKCCPGLGSCTDTTDDTDPVSGDGIQPNGECHANDVAYWQGFNWTSNGIEPTGSLDSNLVASQPRYVVERMPNVAYCKPSGLPPPCTSPNTAADRYYYRITTRAVGKDSNAIVVLQTMYEYTD